MSGGGMGGQARMGNPASRGIGMPQMYGSAGFQTKPMLNGQPRGGFDFANAFLNHGQPQGYPTTQATGPMQGLGDAFSAVENFNGMPGDPMAPRMMDTGGMAPPPPNYPIGPMQTMMQNRQMAPGRQLVSGGVMNPDGTVGMQQYMGGRGGPFGDYANADGSITGPTGTFNGQNLVNGQLWHPEGLSQGGGGPSFAFNNWLSTYLPQYAQAMPPQYASMPPAMPQNNAIARGVPNIQRNAVGNMPPGWLK